MRQTGIVSDWKHDKGFGFITPVGVGTKLFVHVSEFERGARRPAVGDRVDYQLDTGSGKGPRARRVRFVDAATATPARSAPLRFATVVAVAYLAWLAFAVSTRRLDVYVLAWYFVASVMSLASYAIDKSAAREGQRRTSEATLHFVDTLGGWPGGAFAQQWLRHKSSKRSFAFGYWMSVVVNVAGVVLAFTAVGRDMFASLAEHLR
jgi:uncharacterized membrane protein YsdA (DUF1294 family)/cold shock CspA family protein